jgi:hypothetical protein
MPHTTKWQCPVCKEINAISDEYKPTHFCSAGHECILIGMFYEPSNKNNWWRQAHAVQDIILDPPPELWETNHPEQDQSWVRPYMLYAILRAKPGHGKRRWRWVELGETLIQGDQYVSTGTHQVLNDPSEWGSIDDFGYLHLGKVLDNVNDTKRIRRQIIT